MAPIIILFTTRIAAGILEAYPGETRTVGVNLRPLRSDILGEVDRPLLLLLCAAGFLLLLACSILNVYKGVYDVVASTVA